MTQIQLLANFFLQKYTAKFRINIISPIAKYQRTTVELR